MRPFAVFVLLISAAFASLFVPTVAAHYCHPDPPSPPLEPTVNCGPCEESVITGHDHADNFGNNCQSDPCALTDIFCVIEIVKNIITAPTGRGPIHVHQ